MGFRDPRDPHDPWAWRNTWTGEARTSYEELWIVIPLASLLVLVALLLLLPLLLYKCCPTILPKLFHDRFEKFLHVLHEVGREKVMKRSNEMSFENPAFSRADDVERGFGGQRLPTQLRASVRSVRRPRGRKCSSRSQSCPANQVPKIRL